MPFNHSIRPVPPPYRLENNYEIDIIKGIILDKVTKHQKFNQINSNGYYYEIISSRQYLLHRIIYFWATGEIPQQVIHIDLNKANNRLSNLKPVFINPEILTQKQIENKISKTCLHQEYESEPIIKQTSFTNPPQKKDKTLSIDSNPIILNNEYSCRRTTRGNWALSFKGKHLCMCPTYEFILEKYITPSTQINP